MMCDSALTQPEIGADGEQNGSEEIEGGEERPPGGDNEGTQAVDAAASGRTEGEDGHEFPAVAGTSSVVQDSAGATSEQVFDAEIFGAPLESDAFSRRPEQASPMADGDGRGDGEVQRRIDDQRQEHRLGATTASAPESPGGFGMEDDAVQRSIRGGEEEFDGDGRVGTEERDSQMYPTSNDSKAPPGRHSADNVGNDAGYDNADGMEGGKRFGERSRQEADDDSGSRRRRMFDGSRVAEPDDVQVVDAGEGADLIAGVDDLPIFANDQSKALNDEIKVRQKERAGKDGAYYTKV